MLKMKTTRPVSSRRRSKSKGAGLLEAALVLLTLLSLIIFVMDMGRILMMEQFIAERTRATVRMAVVNNWSTTQAKNYLVYNSTAGSGTGYFGLIPSQVAVTTSGTAGSSDHLLKVTVSGVPVLTWIPGIAGQYTLPPITATSPAQSLGATN